VLGGPLRAGARATLLRRVSVALWRSHSRAVAIGYSRCFGIAADPVGEEKGVYLFQFHRVPILVSKGGSPRAGVVLGADPRPCDKLLPLT